MLTAEEKARIRAEEIFRDEVRKELADKSKRRSGVGGRMWEALNSAFVLWFLGSVVVGYLTFHVQQKHERARREEEAKRAIATERRDLAARRLSSAIDLVPHLSSDKADTRSIALEILRTSSLNSERYAQEIKRKLEASGNTPLTNRQKDEAARKWDRGEVPVATELAATVPARIYVHVPIDKNREREFEIVRKVLESGGQVVVRIPISQPEPDRTTVKYYEVPERSAEERAEAKRIIQTLKPHFPTMNTDPQPIAGNPRVRPRRFELWFAKDL